MSTQRETTREEFRKVKRFAVQLPCKFLNKEDAVDGTVLNLSAQGCAITAERLPSASTYVSLHIHLLDGDTPITIELAGVRWASEQLCGIEFIRISSEMLLRLQAFALLLEKTP